MSGDADLVPPLRDVAIRAEAAETVARWGQRLAADEQRIADYAVVTELGYPAYLGGPFASRRAAST